MAEYIEREAFIAEQRHLYCENCAKRKGMKNGKMKFLYGIGDAPCRSCEIGDVLDAVEDFPAADVRPVVRGKWEEVEVVWLADIEEQPDAIATMFCPKCKRFANHVYHYGDPTHGMNFCPNCGADMREPPKEGEA